MTEKQELLDRQSARSSQRSRFISGPYQDIIEQNSVKSRIKSQRLSGIQDSSEKTETELVQQELESKGEQTVTNTSLAICNTMVGAVVLTLPGQVLNGGMLLALVIMFVTYAIQQYTCRIIQRAAIENEFDISSTVERILGKVWAKVMAFGSCIVLFIVTTIYFILICSTGYPIVTFFMDKSGNNNYHQAVDDITWDIFSIQYFACIVIVPVFGLLCIKKMDVLVGLAKYGVLAHFVYMSFLMYWFIQNFVNGNVKNNMGDYKLFTADIAGVSGNFSTAFFVHNSILNITAALKKKADKEKSVIQGYTLACIIYTYITFVGSFAMLGRIEDTSSVRTFNDFFEEGNTLVFIVNLVFFGHLITVLPLLASIVRTQFFTIFFGDSDISTVWTVALNILLCIWFFLIQIFVVNPNLMIGIAGSVVGLVFQYFLPLTFRVKCLKQGESIKSWEWIMWFFVTCIGLFYCLASLLEIGGVSLSPSQ